MSETGEIVIRCLRLAGSDPAVPLPALATEGAAGADLRANLAPQDREGGLLLRPGARILVPTGLALEIPPGHEVQIRPRSGLALRHGVTVLNAPGTIDSDYRGEVGVLLVNLGEAPFVVSHGMRIAQMVPARVMRGRFVESAELAGSARGTGGFGSTGTG